MNLLIMTWAEDPQNAWIIHRLPAKHWTAVLSSPLPWRNCLSLATQHLQCRTSSALKVVKVRFQQAALRPTLPPKVPLSKSSSVIVFSCKQKVVRTLNRVHTAAILYANLLQTWIHLRTKMHTSRKTLTCFTWLMFQSWLPDLFVAHVTYLISLKSFDKNLTVSTLGSGKNSSTKRLGATIFILGVELAWGCVVICPFLYISLFLQPFEHKYSNMPSPIHSFQARRLLLQGSRHLMFQLSEPTTWIHRKMSPKKFSLLFVLQKGWIFERLSVTKVLGITKYMALQSKVSTCTCLES